MDPVFKNSGRGSIRADKIAKETGYWKPSFGTYSPLMYSVKVNDAEKLNHIDPEPKNSASALERKIDLQKQ